MKNDDKGFCHIFVIGVLAVMGLREGAFTDMHVHVIGGQCLGGIVGIRKSGGLGGDDDFDRSHVPHCLRDAIGMLQLKVVGNVLEGFIEEGSIIWPCIVKGVVLDLLCFSSKLVAGSVVVVVPALAMTAIAPLAVVPSLLGRRPLPRCPCLVLILDHGCVYFLRIRLIDTITMNTMIALPRAL